MTPPYAEVIGDPIVQSKSPLIHNFWLQKLGIVGQYRSERVTAQSLAAYLATRRLDPAWRGCNVTMPLKQCVVPMVESVGADIVQIGAMNIVLATTDGLVGRNSDGVGFLESLGEFATSGGSAALFGTGGAARAIAVSLVKAGFAVTIHGRTLDRASDFASSISPTVRAQTLLDEPFAEPSECPWLLINATSLGMTGMPSLPVSLAGLPNETLIYDIVTSPVETDLLRDARERGMRTFDGLQMLIAQAALAFELFFGQPAPRQHDLELRKRLVE